MVAALLNDEMRVSFGRRVDATQVWIRLSWRAGNVAYAGFPRFVGIPPGTSTDPTFQVRAAALLSSLDYVEFKNKSRSVRLSDD